MAKTPYKTILPYIEQIEILLKDKKLSPQAIANALGIPEKWHTIHRYKKEYFNLKEEAGEEWTEERQKNHEQRKAEGKAEIIDNFELLNLRKQRARELLEIDVGEDNPFRQAAFLWSQGDRISDNTIRQELELLGDDPESRKAQAMESLTDNDLDARITELIERGERRVKEVT